MGRNDPSPARPCLCYWPAVPLMVTCAQCRKVVLEADRIGDEEECALRDHLLAVHPNTRRTGIRCPCAPTETSAQPHSCRLRTGCTRPC